MAIGDDAAAAGMDLVSGSSAANTLDTEDNKSRDYIAHFGIEPGTALSIARGGTAATTASGARTNLGLGSAAVATASTAATADTVVMRGTAGRIAVGTPVGADNAATKAYVDGAVAGVNLSSRVAKTGDTMTGDLFLPNSTAANSGYTIGYINGDGRVSRGASSEQFKKYITPISPSVLGEIFPELFRFQMRQGDGSWRFGYIAERLAESEALRPFVVWETQDDGKTLALDADGHPIPLSIDFISLLIVQVAQLHIRVAALEAGR